MFFFLNLPLKNVLRHRLIEENGFAYTSPNHEEKDRRLVEAFSIELLPFFRKDETEARRYACVHHTFVRVVMYLSKRQASPLAGTKADPAFPFPQPGIHWGPSFQESHSKQEGTNLSFKYFLSCQASYKTTSFGRLLEQELQVMLSSSLGLIS